MPRWLLAPPAFHACVQLLTSGGIPVFIGPVTDGGDSRDTVGGDEQCSTGVKPGVSEEAIRRRRAAGPVA